MLADINTIVLFVIGFYILMRGARAMVDGAAFIAKYYKVSTWVVGVVVVGIGTSLPELSINLASIWNGADIGLSTIIGSNIFNTLFILGLASVLFGLEVRREWIRKDFILNILSIGLLIVFLFINLGDAGSLTMGRYEGIIALSLFFAWLYYMVHNRSGELEDTGEYKLITFGSAVFLIVSGFVGVFLGGHWVVKGAEFIASSIGVSDTLIGLTIVSIGTSLPEIAVSLTAALKRQPGIAIGNIIGSNIFDFLGILGLTAIFRPLYFSDALVNDSFIVLGVAAILFLLMFVGKRQQFTRPKGLLLIVFYLLYLLMIILRG